MKSSAMVALCCAGAQAFVPVPKGSIGVETAQRVQSSSTVMMAKSKALPFLDQPAALDGTMPGDFGFDPLGLTENIDLPYACGSIRYWNYFENCWSCAGRLLAVNAIDTQSRGMINSGLTLSMITVSMIAVGGMDGRRRGKRHEHPAEIKHGRISMLAVVGFLLTQYVHLPGDQFQVGPLEAVTSLPLAVHVQIFSFIAVFEASSIFTTFSDKKDPWELLIQDPSGSKGFYKKDAAEQERLKQSEVKHSRLAMFAIIGEVVQMMLYHKPSLTLTL